MKSVTRKVKKKKKRYLNDVQFSTDKKLATTQDRQTLQNSDEKQYCQYWILIVMKSNIVRIGSYCCQYCQ